MNAVNPGVIVTEIHKRGGMSDESYDAFLQHSKTTHAMGRVGDVSEVREMGHIRLAFPNARRYRYVAFNYIHTSADYTYYKDVNTAKEGLDKFGQREGRLHGL